MTKPKAYPEEYMKERSPEGYITIEEYLTSIGAELNDKRQRMFAFYCVEYAKAQSSVYYKIPHPQWVYVNTYPADLLQSVYEANKERLHMSSKDAFDRVRWQGHPMIKKIKEPKPQPQKKPKAQKQVKQTNKSPQSPAVKRRIFEP